MGAHKMKTYKNITYALLTLSVMIFLSAGQVWAHMEPGDLNGFNNSISADVKVSDNSNMVKTNPLDFNKGRNAGFEAGRENVNSCSIGSSGTALDDDMNRGKSREYVAGFDSGFKDVASLYSYSYCGR